MTTPVRRTDSVVVADDRTQEAERLASLRSYRILDTDSDESFELLCRLAAIVCGTPMALINLLDEQRVWSLAAFGPPQPRETPREESFCAEVVATRAPVIVPAARADERYAGRYGVVGEPFVQAYAGVPLGGRDGLPLGALCVVDSAARSFDADQVALLEGLAEQASALLELRRIRLLLLPLAPTAGPATDRFPPRSDDGSPAPADNGSGNGSGPTLGTDVGAAADARAWDRLIRGADRDPSAALRAESRLAELAGLSRLTNRELDIVGRLLRGDRVPAIAETLFLSQSTVRNHLSSVFGKLRVSSQQQLLDLLRGQDRAARLTG